MSTIRIRSHSMDSPRTTHRARSVGDSGWVVSYLPGRTLSAAQAVAAMAAAEEVAALAEHSRLLGLTGLELVSMASAECPWPQPRGLAARALSLLKTPR